MKLNLLFAYALVLLSFQCIQNKEKELVISSKQKEKVIISESLETEELKVKVVKQETIRDSLVNFAKTFIDVPYLYSSQDPKKGFDCSGFVNYVFKNFDIHVPRSSSGFKKFGKSISVDEVALGDVLVFKGYQDSTSVGHVGIVCKANGKYSKFIHASSGKAMKVTISELNSSHYTKRFYKAINVID